MSTPPTTIEDLFDILDQFDGYPDLVKPTPERIRGMSFFPGGFGLWNPSPNDQRHLLPARGIMVIGHNFDSFSSYHESLRRGTEKPKGATWLHLLAFLQSVGIPCDDCFYTNAYVGVIDGNSAVGNFPGAKDPAFVAWCQEFLAFQIEIMRPRLILALGKHVPRFLAEMAVEGSQMQQKWRQATSFNALNDENALVHAASFTQTKHTCPVVALIHPAYRPRNVGYRTYNGLTGDAAEVAMVRAALA